MMTTPVCPGCRRVIPSDDINVAKDLAYCRSCNAAHSLSTMLDAGDIGTGLDLQNPPAGVSYQKDTLGTVIRASHRSWGTALGLLAISLFWNGIVSVFVLVALSGTLHQLGIPVPDWFPAPKMNGEDMSTGGLLFLWIFLTPFILVGTGMVLALVSSVVGRTEVCIRPDEGRVFVGIGPLGWTRRFVPYQVKRVALVRTQGDNDSSGKKEIHLEQANGKRLKFGSLLKDERQTFMVSALKQTLL